MIEEASMEEKTEEFSIIMKFAKYYLLLQTDLSTLIAAQTELISFVGDFSCTCCYRWNVLCVKYTIRLYIVLIFQKY